MLSPYDRHSLQQERKSHLNGIEEKKSQYIMKVKDVGVKEVEYQS